MSDIQTELNDFRRKLFIRELDKAFAAMENKKSTWLRDRDDLLNIYDFNMNPDEYFDYLAHGAFKETYMLSSDNYVVKFCSQHNDTDAEQALLEAANEEGVGCAFIPTLFVNYHGHSTPMPNLEADCDSDSCGTWDEKYDTWVENEDWEGRFATGLEIQPTILYTCNGRGERWSYERGYGEVRYFEDGVTHGPTHIISDPAIDPNTGEIIPYEILEVLDIHNKTWIEEYARLYTIAGLAKLADFCDKYHISDLHNGNLGFITSTALGIDSPTEYEVPVILDWLSTDARTIHKIKEVN